MSDSEALRLVFDRANALQTYWTFYATTAGVLLAFFGTKQRGRVVAGLLTVAFIALTAANLWALRDVTRQRLELQKFFTARVVEEQCDSVECKTALAVQPATLGWVSGLHILSDLGWIQRVAFVSGHPPRAETLFSIHA